MGLVIDTNVFIDAENGRLEIDKLDQLAQHNNVFIAAITISELLAGVHLAKKPDLRVRRSAFVEAIIGKVPVLEFNEEVARVYAEIYSYILKARNKREANVHDLQIAATAIAYGYPVLTSNTADFKKYVG